MDRARRRLVVSFIVGALGAGALLMGTGAPPRVGQAAGADASSCEGGAPKGAVIIWWGSLSSAPGGWQLCDGTNGTKDLRDRFAVGAGTSFAVDAVGGAASHAHTAPAHSHTVDVAAFSSAPDNDVGPCSGKCLAWADDFQPPRPPNSLHRHALDPPSITAGPAAAVVDAAASLPPFRALYHLCATSACAQDLPSGAVAMWSGSLGAIPPAWKVCDGTGGTPDLRDRFILGAGGAYAVGSEGGAAAHAHGSAAHAHTVPAAPLTVGTASQTPDLPRTNYVHHINGNDAHVHTLPLPATSTSSTAATVDQTAVMPPYHALFFICRS